MAVSIAVAQVDSRPIMALWPTNDAPEAEIVVLANSLTSGQRPHFQRSGQFFCVHRKKYLPTLIYMERRLIMRRTLFSTTDCARAVGVPEHRLAYAHRSGKLPEPELRVAGKRVYQPHEVRQVAAYFAGVR